MTFEKVSVLVPTRGRVAQLAAMRASFYATARAEAELVFRIDEDDRATHSYLIESREPRVLVGPRHQSYRSLPLFFNEMARAASGDVFMCGNDDMVFRTTDWPQLLLAQANQFPDGVFDIGVATLNEDNYPFSVVSRAVTERLGFLWDPRIFWGDMYLRDVMAAFGRCVKLPTVEVSHEWAGHARDPVFGEPDDIYLRDPAYWTGTHAIVVADAVAKLRGMVVV